VTVNPDLKLRLFAWAWVLCDCGGDEDVCIAIYSLAKQSQDDTNNNKHQCHSYQHANHGRIDVGLGSPLVLAPCKMAEMAKGQTTQPH